MIKQVQLRGISRTPSDRMIADGGCAESLNVQMEDQELAPMLCPKDVTSEKTGTAGLPARPVFIHKAMGAENYILVDEEDAKVRISTKDGVIPDFEASIAGETFRFASSIGNTVLVHTDKHTHYILLKETGYKYLGTRIPKPILDLQVSSSTSSNVVYVDPNSFRSQAAKSFVYYVTQPEGVLDWAERFAEITEGYDSSETVVTGYTNKEMVDALTDELWRAVTDKMVDERSNDRFCFPMLARCALRLYDGSYIYQSEPMFLNGSNQSVRFMLTPYDNKVRVALRFSSIKEASYRVTCKGAEEWKDIVSSVAVAVTPEIYNPSFRSRPVSSKVVYDGLQGFDMMMEGMNDVNSADDMEEKVLAASLFYKIDDVLPDEMAQGGISPVKPLKVPALDLLVQKERIPDDDGSHQEILPISSVMEYNQRLIFSGISRALCSGNPVLGGYTGFNHCKYFVHSSDGSEHTVLARNREGNADVARPMSWVFYPDAGCYKVQIYGAKLIDGAYRYVAYEVAMKPHPMLNGSYAFSGFNDDEADFITDCPYVPMDSLEEFMQENPAMMERRKVAMSKVANPFVFPAIGRLSFSEEVLAAATTTKALSEGQFGQYPVIVFTRGGVWAVSLSGTGEFISSTPLSRDVAVSAESVTPIDDAIVFVTESGVKVLQGSDVSDISSGMNGRHFSLVGDDDIGGVALDAISRSAAFGFLEPSLTDDTPFMGFMKKSTCAFDYKGGRLLFMSKDGDESYRYVYNLRTQTWHKMQEDMDGFLNEASFLNSYPDVLMSGSRTDGGEKAYRIYDLSTVLDLTERQDALPGIVITRTMDFDNDNVRKVIKDLRLRGRYAKGNVRYMLMVSNDGLRWRVIRSLQGCSYNLFRLVVLLNMSADERFSYIDIDYETRFTDKLR